MTHNSKSQSALEYMMSYGWAILIIVIVAAALWSFGVFNPSASTSSTSITGFSGIAVTSAEANSNLFAIYVTDTVGYAVNITGINVTFNGQTYSTFQCGSGNAAFFTLAPQASATCDVAGSFPSPVSASVSIGYIVQNGLTPYTISQGLIRTPALPSNQITPVPGLFAYVANNGGASLSVINTATNTVMATISGSTNPSAVAVASNGQYAYATTLAGGHVLSIINPASNTVSSTISVPSWGASSLSSVALTPDGKYAYVTQGGQGNTISIINTSNNQVWKNISVGSEPEDIAISPNGKFAYTANVGGSGSFSIINITSVRGVSNVTVGLSQPIAVTITPNSKYVYISNQGSGKVAIINSSNGLIWKNITVGSDPRGLAVTPDGKYVYVANEGGGTVSVINTTSNTVLTTITVGSFPEAVAILPSGRYAYVTIYAGKVSVINTVTNSVVQNITVGSSPDGIAIGNSYSAI